MEYVRLGSTGLKVSRICLGCMSFGSGMDWSLGEEDSRAITDSERRVPALRLPASRPPPIGL